MVQRKNEVADAVDSIVKGFEKLNPVLNSSTAFSEKFKNNLVSAANAFNQAGVGGQPGGTSTNNLLPTPMFSGSDTLNAAKNVAMGVVGAANIAMPSVNNALELQLTASRASMAGMNGNVQGLLGQAMAAGTSTGQMDAARAMAYGNANGLTTGLSGYGNVLSGQEALSNLVPGAGQLGGMQANVALQQGSSVNMLRMIGINARDANGQPRSAADVFKEFYNWANNASGKGAPTKQELAQSLMPGNAMSNLINQYFGGDPVLKQGVTAAAEVMAGGKDLTKQGITAAGGLTPALNSQSGKYSSEYDALSAATKPLTDGFIEANNILIKVNKQLEHLYANSKEAQWALKQLAKANTLASDHIGQSGIMLATLFGHVAGGLLSGPLAKLMGGGGGSAAAGGRLAGMGRAERAGLAGLAFGGLEFLQHGLNSAFGKHVPKIVQEIGNFAFDLGEGAVVGGLAGGGVGAVAGMAALGVGGAMTDFKGGGSGNGLGATTAANTVSNSIANNSTGVAGAVIAAGKSQFGTPYSWGGGNTSGPTTGMAQGAGTTGFDCSSLMQFIFAKVGVNLPRTTWEQMKIGVRIDPTQAQPGDLLFFENGGHVAVYVGNNQMIQAPHTGGHVEQVGVNLRGVFMARRVLNSATGTSLATSTTDSPASPTDPSTANHNLFSQFPALNSLSGAGTAPSAFANSSLVGYSPESAMSGGFSGGSGSGMGSTSGRYLSAMNNRSTSAGAQAQAIENTHAAMSNQPTQGGVVYENVTLHINVPATAKIDEKVLAKELKTQLKDLGISLKVANS